MNPAHEAHGLFVFPGFKKKYTKIRLSSHLLGIVPPFFPHDQIFFYGVAARGFRRQPIGFFRYLRIPLTTQPTTLPCNQSLPFVFPQVDIMGIQKPEFMLQNYRQ
jgi:hypothetical protein